MLSFEYVVWAQDDRGNRFEVTHDSPADARVSYVKIVESLKEDEHILTRIFGGPCVLPAVGTAIRLRRTTPEPDGKAN